ncbi:hypothetical protein BG003_003167 [Podila horticola]|nr:hypothetical protein BG003_003167 [Podila horticola]
MLANKTFNIFVIATAFMLLATVEAAPAAEAAAQGPTTHNMLANRTLRPLFIAATVVIMLLATVEAAPAADALRCVVCEDPPIECNLRCPGGYCDIDLCRCRPVCRKGMIP